MSSRPSISAPAALEPPRSFSAYAFPTGERAIIHAKKPPTATIGIMSAITPSISVRRREPLGAALLGQQSLGEVHPLLQLRHLLPQLLELLRDGLALPRIRCRGSVLAGDPLGDRRREGSHHPEAATEDEERQCRPFRPAHPLTVPVRRAVRRGPWPAAAPRNPAARPAR